MPNKTVLVNGGLVTSKDASLLEEGELVRADDAYYKTNDFALWKVKGRTAYQDASIGAKPIAGTYLEFDSGPDLILVNCEDGSYRTGPANVSGSFGALVTGLTPGSASLDRTHYNDRWFIFDGKNRIRAITASGNTGVATLVGMLENIAAPTVDTSAGAGAGFTLGTNNTIDYWVEERVKDADGNILKRSAENGGTSVTQEGSNKAQDNKYRRASRSKKVRLTGTGVNIKPVITRPDVVNSDATHWALYATATNGAYPTGAEISEVAIATTTIEDTRTTNNPPIPSGEAYKIVTVSIGGVSIPIAENGEPPIASTGDVLEDSLCVNDVSDGSHLRYSLADNTDAFPEINLIRFETTDGDKITAIKEFSNVLLVFLENSVWKVFTLPRPEDSAFQIERVKSRIHGAQGCVGPMAVAEFSFGTGSRLAYVSRYGISVTDGVSWDVLTDDIDWEASVNIQALGGAVLVNNPRDYRLEFYYPPPGQTRNTRAYYLHYHQSHAKRAEGGGFRAKVTGPITVEASGAFSAVINGFSHIMTVNSTDQKVFLENNGTSDASSAGGIKYVLRTRDVPLNAFGGEARVRRVWTHHQAAPGQTATARIVARQEGQDDYSPPVQTIKMDRRESTATYVEANGELFQFGVEDSSSAGQIAVDYITVDWEPQGVTEADNA